jgi:hypothetical protein
MSLRDRAAHSQAVVIGDSARVSLFQRDLTKQIEVASLVWRRAASAVVIL